jgi:hypothetical protein
MICTDLVFEYSRNNAGDLMMECSGTLSSKNLRDGSSMSNTTIVLQSSKTLLANSQYLAVIEFQIHFRTHLRIAMQNYRQKQVGRILLV